MGGVKGREGGARRRGGRASGEEAMTANQPAASIQELVSSLATTPIHTSFIIIDPSLHTHTIPTHLLKSRVVRHTRRRQHQSSQGTRRPVFLFFFLFLFFYSFFLFSSFFLTFLFPFPFSLFHFFNAIYNYDTVSSLRYLNWNARRGRASRLTLLTSNTPY